MILDRRNGTPLSPVNGFREPLTGTESVTVASVLGFHEPALSISPGTQVGGPVLFISEVGEPVQAHLIGPVPGVMVVDEVEVILKNLEPLVLLSDAVVSFAMPC